MSGKESVKNWVAVFVVLVITSLLAAAWPLLSTIFAGRGGGSGSNILRAGVPLVKLPFIENPVNGFLALFGLVFAVVILVGAVGIGLSFLYTLLTRQAETVKESKEYQTKLSALEKREAERIKSMRNGRQADPIPPHKLPRWSVVSTSLIFLLFTLALSMILSRSLVQEGARIALGSLNISTSLLIVGGLMLTVLIGLAFWIRPQRLDALDATDYGPIPWDAIWVIVTGLIVVGIGLGLVVYLNVPG